MANFAAFDWEASYDERRRKRRPQRSTQKANATKAHVAGSGTWIAMKAGVYNGPLGKKSDTCPLGSIFIMPDWSVA
jgi:hypothetical protein